MTLRISSGDVGKPESGSRSFGIALAAAMAVATGLLVNATATVAQDNDKVKAGLELWKNSGCADCHGSFADGEKQRDEAPTGANLRTTRMKADELKVVIS